MKRISILLYSGFIGGLILQTACYYHKEELLYPQTTCDTVNVRYSNTIAPIMSAFCLSCHAGNFPSGSLKLETYNDVKIQAANGRLWGSVSHTNGFSFMPQNAPKLNDCNLAKIKKWLDAGYPNN